MTRILVISHTCFSSNNSMGSTLASYFMGYDANAVAQFYIKDMVPNMDVCNHYFMISDNDVLGKLLKPWRGCIGKEVEKGSSKSTETGIAQTDNHAKGNRALKMLCRNLVWASGVWNNRKLHDWICKFQPDVILCQPGDFPYLLTLTCKLAKKYNIPIMIHQSETYYLKPMLEHNIAYWIYRRVYKRAYEKLMAHTYAAIYLCDAIKRDYDQFFSVPSYSIMKATNLVPHRKTLHKAEGVKFLYAGNIGQKVGRDRPLVEIGNALKQLGYVLDVYTASTGDHMKDFTEENGIVLHGAVPYDELQAIIEKSDFIIHTESQQEENIIDLKYAFTTKIADMLASGCCPIVYGSPRIASIRYFKETDTACVIEKACDLEKKLQELIASLSQTQHYIDNALEQARQFHSPEKNSKKFAEIIYQVVENYQNTGE